VFASFMLSTPLRLAGALPRGLGAFDAASVVTLRLMGVELPVALSAPVTCRQTSCLRSAQSMPMNAANWTATSRRTRRKIRGCWITRCSSRTPPNVRTHEGWFRDSAERR
jgi:hypothetical protein